MIAEITDRRSNPLALQRHFRALTIFAHVESRLSGRKRPREVVFYAPLNLCDRRACSASVAVGLEVSCQEAIPPPYTTFDSFFLLRSARHTPPLCGLRRIPVFLVVVSAACAPHQSPIRLKAH